MSRPTHLLETTENWLENPITTTIEEAIAQSEILLQALSQEIKRQDADRARIGSLIGRVKGLGKRLRSGERINWVKVGPGYLAIGHRPGADLVANLRLQHATHVLTLLSEKEGSRKVGAFCRDHDLEWLWLPMESARPPAEARYGELAGLFNRIAEILNRGGRIYIHCSAGIHRTGMITTALLRFLGMDEPASREILREMRPTTNEGVGDHRREWGNEVFPALQAAGGDRIKLQ